MSIARNLRLQQAVLLEETATILEHLTDPQASLIIDNHHNVFTLALKESKFNVLALLAAHDAKYNVGARMDKSIQPIHLEAAAANIKAVCNLAEDPALFWCKTSGSTAIQIAAQVGGAKMVSELLKSKALSSKPYSEQVDLLSSVLTQLSEFDFNEQPKKFLTFLVELLSYLKTISGDEPRAWELIAKISISLASLAKNQLFTLADSLSSTSHSKTLYPVCNFLKDKTSPLTQNSLFSSQGDEQATLTRKCKEWDLDVSIINKDDDSVFHALLDQFAFHEILPNYNLVLLREQTIEHIVNHVSHYEEAKVKNIFNGLKQNQGEDAWTNERYLLAAARLLKLKVIIVKAAGDDLPFCFHPKEAHNTVYLGLDGNNHFQSLRYRTLNPVLESLFEATPMDEFSFSERTLPAAAQSSAAPSSLSFSFDDSDDVTEAELEAFSDDAAFGLKR